VSRGCQGDRAKTTELFRGLRQTLGAGSWGGVEMRSLIYALPRDCPHVALDSYTRPSGHITAVISIQRRGPDPRQ
jgi:hypothetical protein